MNPFLPPFCLILQPHTHTPLCICLHARAAWTHLPSRMSAPRTDFTPLAAHRFIEIIPTRLPHIYVGGVSLRHIYITHIAPLRPPPNKYSSSSRPPFHIYSVTDLRWTDCGDLITGDTMATQFCFLLLPSCEALTRRTLGCTLPRNVLHSKWAVLAEEFNLICCCNCALTHIYRKPKEEEEEEEEGWWLGRRRVAEACRGWRACNFKM